MISKPLGRKNSVNKVLVFGEVKAKAKVEVEIEVEVEVEIVVGDVAGVVFQGVVVDIVDVQIVVGVGFVVVKMSMNLLWC